MMQSRKKNNRPKRTKMAFKQKLVINSLIILCGLIMLPLGILAQSEDSASRGLQVGASYTISDIENVNNTNGNVMLNIPLASLPAGRGGLSYGVSLNYNSKMFDTLTEPFFITPPASTQSATILQKSDNGGWRYGYKYKFEQKVRPGDTNGNNSTRCSGPSEPIERYFAIYKFVMTFPDGSSHEFKPSKYYGTVANGYGNLSYYPVDINGEHRKYRNIYTSQPQVWQGCELITYTHTGGMTFHSTDGTNLRLFVENDNDTDPTNNFWTLTMPNGTKVTQNEPLPGGGVAGQRIYDSNGNFVEINETLGQFGQVQSFTATDQMNRALSFTRDSQNSQDVITSTGFNGSSLSWTVKWKSIGVFRNYKIDTDEDRDDFEPSVVQQTFSLVDEIILPTQVGANQKYEFEYNGNPNGDNATISEGFGEIEQIRLPSGAVADYEYELDGLGATVSSWQTVMHNPITSKVLTYETKYDGVSQTVTEKWDYDINRAGSVITSPDGSTSSASYGDRFEDQDSRIHGTGTSNSATRKMFYDYTYTTDGRASPHSNLVRMEYTSIKDSKGNFALTAFKEFAYDSNANLLEVKEYDWIPFDPSYLGYITDVPTNATLKRITKNDYYYATSGLASGQTPNGNEFFEVGSPTLINLMKSKEIQDANGTPVSRTEYIYDNTQTSPTVGNLTETKKWDSTKQATLGTANANGYKLDANNSISISYDYDNHGNKILETDAKGVQTQYSYDSINGYANLYPTQVKMALGLTEERTSTTAYDFDTGLIVSATDVDNGITNSTEYDDLGRSIKVIDAVDTSSEIWTQTEYDVVNQRIITKTDLESKGDGKKVAIQHFDDMGRVRLARTLEDVSTENPYDETDGIKVQSRYQYDNSMNPVSSDGVYTLRSNPYRAATSAAASNEDTMGWSVGYSDKTGRYSTNENFSGASLPAPWGSNSNSTGKSITQADADAKTVTDAAGRQKRSIMNALGQITRIDEPDSTGNLGALSTPVQPTHYQYNTLGKMIEVSQGVQKRHFLYDSLSRMLRVRQPEQEVNSALNKSGLENSNTQWTAGFTYDDNGNALTATDAENKVITTVYDNINRPLTRTYSDGITPNITYTYDETGVPYSKGRLTKVENSVSTTQVSEFDIMGRPKVSQQITDGTTYQMKYKYNLSGELIEEEYPSGRKIKNEFDADGDISRIFGNSTSTSSERTYANSFSYSVDGSIRQLKIGNGRWETAQFNSNLQVTELSLGTSQGNGSLWKVDYEYGELNPDGTVDNTKNVGNIAKQKIDFNGLTNPLEQTYKYDSVDRLTEAKETSNNNQVWKQTYGYDKYSNRIAFTQDILGQNLPINNVTLPTVDANTNRFIANQGYEYDKNGNLTKDITNTESRNIKFDGNNKQTEIKDAATGYKIGEYFYDGSGKRVKKRLFDANGVVTKEIIFVYSGDKLAAEYSTAAPPSNPATKYVATDTIGSIRAITNQDGQVISRRDFMPFGEELQSDTTYRKADFNYNSDDVRQKFTGYQKDEETDLDFAEARMYNNKHARFTAVDPLLASGKSANPQTFNRYAYVMNNPLSYVDPTGLQAGERPQLKKDFDFKGRTFTQKVTKKNIVKVVRDNPGPPLPMVVGVKEVKGPKKDIVATNDDINFEISKYQAAVYANEVAAGAAYDAVDEAKGTLTTKSLTLGTGISFGLAGSKAGESTGNASASITIDINNKEDIDAARREADSKLTVSAANTLRGIKTVATGSPNKPRTLTDREIAGLLAAAREEAVKQANADLDLAKKVRERSEEGIRQPNTTNQL